MIPYWKDTVMMTPSLAPPRPERRFAWLALLTTPVVIATLIAGTLTASAATPASASSITIKDFEFKPTPLKVKAGVKIKITNRDDTTHTLTANKGAFDAGHISPGKTASIVVKKPGTYPYHCEIHNFMKGTIKAS